MAPLLSKVLQYSPRISVSVNQTQQASRLPTLLKMEENPSAMWLPQSLDFRRARVASAKLLDSWRKKLILHQVLTVTPRLEVSITSANRPKLACRKHARQTTILLRLIVAVHHLKTAKDAVSSHLTVLSVDQSSRLQRRTSTTSQQLNSTQTSTLPPSWESSTNRLSKKSMVALPINLHNAVISGYLRACIAQKRLRLKSVSYTELLVMTCSKSLARFLAFQSSLFQNRSTLLHSLWKKSNIGLMLDQLLTLWRKEAQVLQLSLAQVSGIEAPSIWQELLKSRTLVQAVTR